MQLAIRDLLGERTAPASRQRKATILGLSLGVHVLLFGSFLLAPWLSAGDNEMPEYVAVQIIPAQMLGTTTPEPTRPEPAEQPPAPEPEPEPVVPEPREEPQVREPSPQQAPPKIAPKRVETRPAAPTQRQGSAQGSSLGTSNFGTRIAAFDNPDFTYDYYVDQMLGRIRQYWTRPPIGGTVETTIAYRILKDGRVVDVRILQSSGYNSFDLAAMRAIQSASPLPPLPQSFKHDSLGVNLVVR